MKRIKNICWVLLLLLAGFSSCDKNEVESVRNAEEADVPEGYMKVSFPGEETAETRAVNGNDNRIGHLQYLLYKQDDAGDFKLDKESSKIVFKDKLNSNTKWPLETPVYCFLPINKTYKIVFLGNVDKSVFSNKTAELLENVADGSSYGEARILAPTVNFSNGNMYHVGVSEEFSTDPNQHAGGKMNVPILLQRIVSRNVLTREGVDNAADLNNKLGYTGAYYANALRKGKPLGDQVFYGVRSALANQLHTYLLKDFVFPLVFMLKHNKCDVTNAPQATAWYDSNKSYTDNYTNWVQIKKDLTEYKGWAFDPDNRLFIPYIVELVEKIYSRDEAVFGALIQSIITADLPDPGITFIPDNHKSFTLLKNAMVSSLYNTKGYSPLTPWSDFSDITINQGKVPVSVDFDLKKASYTTENVGEKKYPLIRGSKGPDSSIEVITLGEKEADGTIKFEFSTLALHVGGATPYPILLPATSIAGTAFLPNQSSTYKLVPEKIDLGALLMPAAENTNKLFFNYQTILDAIGSSISVKADGTSVAYRINVVLHCVYGKRGDLTDGPKDPVLRDVIYSAEIVTPDFGSSNMTVTMKWE